MKELVRCRPCGYVMEAHKLGKVCPACGLPAKVFEPYREKVSSGRKAILDFDLHPIAIHLSQTFVILIPLLSIAINLFSKFHHDLIRSVIAFCVLCFPFTLLLAIATGMIDGYTRFKTYKTPFLQIKILYSSIIFILSVVLFFVGPYENYGFFTILISLLCLAVGVRLGLWEKQLINVILPGTFPKKKAKNETYTKEATINIQE